LGGEQKERPVILQEAVPATTYHRDDILRSVFAALFDADGATCVSFE
jgi:hypothetical protein